MRIVLAVILVSVACLSHAVDAYVTVVGVSSNGTIVPPGTAASLQTLAEVAAGNVATAAAADANQQASTNLSLRISAVENAVVSQRAHAIFRGFVLSFSSAVAPVTNCDVQIIGFATRTVGTNVHADISTYFSVAPSSAPTVEYRARLSDGEWAYLSSISNTWPDTVSVATTNGAYEAYLSTVAVPSAMGGAFFRVNGAVSFISADDSVLDVPGGLSVNGKVGVTTNLVCGSVTNHFLGGVLVP